ncbi:MAG TPA: hypothetical protein VF059_09325 [Casimicrobiaceae bacterium]
MYRKQLSGSLQWTVLALALGASGAALADDSSMSRLTGDSYAFFNGLEYRAGHFNVAKSPQPQASQQAAEDSGSMPGARRAMTIVEPKAAIVPPATFDYRKGT